MRQVEIAAGLVLVAAAVVLAFGLGGPAVPVLPAGFAAPLVLAVAGSGLVADGALALRIRAHTDDGGPLRIGRRSLATVIAAVVLVLLLPPAIGPLNLVAAAGFPLGFYVSAQGLLVLFGILAFRAARRLDEDDARSAAGAAGDGNG